MDSDLDFLKASAKNTERTTAKKSATLRCKAIDYLHRTKCSSLAD